MLRKLAQSIRSVSAKQVVAPTVISDIIYDSDQDRETAGLVSRFTLTNEARISALIRSVRYLSKYSIPGAFVECGVWKGGSMMAVAYTLLHMGDSQRELFQFDTFEGMTPPTSRDVSWNGGLAHEILADTQGNWGLVLCC